MNRRYCLTCGAEISENAERCPVCGAVIKMNSSNTDNGYYGNQGQSQSMDMNRHNANAGPQQAELQRMRWENEALKKQSELMKQKQKKNKLVFIISIASVLVIAGIVICILAFRGNGGGTEGGPVSGNAGAKSTEKSKNKSTEKATEKSKDTQKTTAKATEENTESSTKSPDMLTTGETEEITENTEATENTEVTEVTENTEATDITEAQDDSNQGEWREKKNGRQTYRYYADENGDPCTGWKKIDGFWYYLDSEGRPYVSGRKEIDGKLYYFDEGIMQIGWVELYEGAYKIYCDENGEMLTGTQEIDGKVYEFDSQGRWRNPDADPAILKGLDLNMAGMFETIMGVVLSSENCYDEISRVADDYTYLFAIDEDGKLTSKTGESFEYTAEEFRLDLGQYGSPILYKAKGADHWLVGVKNYTPMIYLANQDESMIWQLSPEVDPEYQ